MNDENNLGPEGQGMSFYINEMTANVPKNALVTVIDCGGSYKKLCETLGRADDFVEVDPKNGLAISPFK